MKLRSIVAASAVAFVVVACGPQESPPASDGTWVGTITTEGNVTTVMNKSGSVWGGTATLVEEASIGVAEGEQWGMLGLVRAAVASDERIYVLDTSGPIVRAYTIDGDYLRDVGGRGEGPGEYLQPFNLAIAPDGRLFLHDGPTRRLSIYSPHGDLSTSYFLPFNRSAELVVTPDGVPYGPVVVDPDAVYYRTSFGMLAHGPDGPMGSPLIPPRYDLQVPRLGGGGRRGIAVPHAPGYVWAMDTDANMIAGVGDTYSFEIARRDGSRILVQRTFEPVPVEKEERDAAIEKSTAFMRFLLGDLWTWDGPEVPWFKPAFVKFLPTQSGELWVIRPGVGQKTVRPDGGVSWKDTYIVDAFNRDGRFLGEIEMPEGVEKWIGYYAFEEGGPFAFVRGETVIMLFEDEAGTIMVKRYRLVLPGQQ